MKKKSVIIFLFLSLSITSAYACDICGCGVNNYYIGILPQFNHKFFGIRYHLNSFNTRLKDDPGQFSRDLYQSVELWGGWNVSNRIQILALVPFNFNYQSSDEGVQRLRGMGDVVVLANYKVLDVNSVSADNKIFSQQIWIGAGIKLPSGKFEIEENDPDIASSANRQLGSGSTDILLNAMYNIRIHNFGINTAANYKFNSVNRDAFRFGDKFTASSFIFYPVRSSETVISPNLGLEYEHSNPSELANSKIDLTGGDVLHASAGVEISFDKIALGLNAQLPLAQNFAESQTKSRSKVMAHVSFAF